MIGVTNSLFLFSHVDPTTAKLPKQIADASESLDVMSVETKVIMQGTVRNVGVSFVMRASKLSVGKRASTSGPGWFRKRDESELSESSEASPEQRVEVGSVASGTRATGLDSTVQTMLMVAALA